MKGFVPVFFLIFGFGSCSMLVMDGANLQDGSLNVLIVADKNLYDQLSPSLSQYRDDLAAEGSETELVSFSGSPEELRTILSQYTGGGWAAFFLGDIPSVSYEQEILEGYEEFPVDLYYSDPDSVWEDINGNGIFDSHTPLSVTVPVSRVTGSPEELTAYFDKIHSYRTNGLTFTDRALIFKDDDWSNYRQGKDFGLSNLVSEVTLIENLPDTKKPDYVAEASGSYRYVYQWIHAIPFSLYVQEEEDFRAVTVLDIREGMFDNGFYNLFNCKAARYSQDNLGMTYLTNTESGLAAIGSTKVGGIFEPLEFHRSLSAGLHWGRAYMNWYNQTGVHDDSWYLGIVILGDPALKVSPDAMGQRNIKAGTAVSELIPPSDEEKSEHLQNLTRFEQLQDR